MTNGYESLGKASLDLEANVTEFERNIRDARGSADRMEHALEGVAAISRIANRALNDVKMNGRQALESRAAADGILGGVKGISDESMAAARELHRVKITERQATESQIAGDRIEGKLNGITRRANEARRATESVGIAGFLERGGGGGGGRFGGALAGVGATGLGIGAGALLAPAAAPAAIGLLGAIPALAFTGAGALGTLMLAFKGVGKAISGDKKAFDDLTPAAQKFVLSVRSLDGFFDKLRQTAAAGLFPGLTAGLHAALSPGTVAVLTRSIGLLSRALGSAFAEFGRYFGSPQFQALLGPLMQAGAQNIRLMADAALHLLDALAVLGRAAIPFTTFLLTAVDRGARFVSAWLRAKDATGGLSRAMDAAKGSVSALGSIVGSLGRILAILGQILYPIARVALKELAVGLHKLVGIVERNRAKIREIVSGALAAFIAAIKIGAKVVGFLFKALERVVHLMGGGWKTAFEIVLGGLLIKKFIGVASAIGKGVKALGKFVKLLKVIAKWTAIDDALSGGLGGGAGGAGKAGKLAKLLRIAKGAGILTLGVAAADAAVILTTPGDSGPRKGSGDIVRDQHGRFWRDSNRGFVRYEPKPGDRYRVAKPGGGVYPELHVYHAPPSAAVSERHAALGDIKAPRHRRRRLHRDPPADPTGPSPFGKEPPFTTNVAKPGKPPVIPARVSHLEALASQQASRASVLGNKGPVAQHDLELELADLAKADQLLLAKYQHAHGRARTQLFAAITSVENRMRTVRERIAKALVSAKQSREQHLKLVLDEAKLAVENARKGTAAYDRAVRAEERALLAEIAYYDKRAHNMKLSVALRDKALRAEVAAKKQLAALEKQATGKTTAAGRGGAGANEAQFLSSFKQIVGAFAPNAFPLAAVSAGRPGAAKTDSHLYDLVHESRMTNRYLRDLVAKHAFPSTGYALESAGGVAG